MSDLVWLCSHGPILVGLSWSIKTIMILISLNWPRQVCVFLITDIPTWPPFSLKKWKVTTLMDNWLLLSLVILSYISTSLSSSVCLVFFLGFVLIVFSSWYPKFNHESGIHFPIFSYHQFRHLFFKRNRKTGHYSWEYPEWMVSQSSWISLPWDCCQFC